MIPAAIGFWVFSQVLAVTAVPTWSTDYGDAVRLARSSHRPLVVVLEDPTRPGGLAGALDTAPLRLALRSYSVCRVDVTTDKGTELKQQLNATTVPYTIVSDETGRSIVVRAAGDVSPETFLALLGETVDVPVERRAEALDAGKSVSDSPLELVIVSTKGCVYCEKVKLETLPNPDVQRLIRRRVKVTLVDASQDDTLAKKHHVLTYPSILLLDERGNLLDRMEGFVEGPQLARRLLACKSRRDLRRGG